MRTLRLRLPHPSIEPLLRRLSIIDRYVLRMIRLISWQVVPVVKKWWVFTYIVVTGILSQLTLLAAPKAGVYINAAVIMALAGLALRSESVRQLAIATAIVPVSLMISLTLPSSNVFIHTTTFYAALLLLGLMYQFMFTINYPQPFTAVFGWGWGYLSGIPLMLVVGQVLGGVGYIMLRNHYTFGHTPLPLVALTAVVYAIGEEIVFRGLIQQRAILVMSTRVAVLFTTLLYMLTSIGMDTVLSPIFALLSGGVLSYVYYKKQNLVLTITVNGTMKLLYIGLIATFTLHRL